MTLPLPPASLDGTSSLPDAIVVGSPSWAPHDIKSNNVHNRNCCIPSTHSSCSAPRRVRVGAVTSRSDRGTRGLDPERRVSGAGRTLAARRRYPSLARLGCRYPALARLGPTPIPVACSLGPDAMPSLARFGPTPDARRLRALARPIAVACALGPDADSCRLRASARRRCRRFELRPDAVAPFNPMPSLSRFGGQTLTRLGPTPSRTLRRLHPVDKRGGRAYRAPSRTLAMPSARSRTLATPSAPSRSRRRRRRASRVSSLRHPSRYAGSDRRAADAARRRACRR